MRRNREQPGSLCKQHVDWCLTAKAHHDTASVRLQAGLVFFYITQNWSENWDISYWDKHASFTHICPFLNLNHTHPNKHKSRKWMYSISQILDLGVGLLGIQIYGSFLSSCCRRNYYLNIWSHLNIWSWALKHHRDNYSRGITETRCLCHVTPTGWTKITGALCCKHIYFISCYTVALIFAVLNQ